MNKKILTEDNIVMGAEYTDRFEAIRACGMILLSGGYIQEAYIDDMLERERLCSVYVGNHVAIPHGVANSERNIIQSGISVLQLKNGVDFGEEKAYLMFGIAGKDGSHIEILSQIAQICMDEENIQKMCEAKEKKEILQILNISI